MTDFSQFSQFSPLFEDALKVDQLLFQLATYEASNGFILTKEDMESVVEFQAEVVKKFNHFKRLIQNGEMTLLEIGKRIASKHGPFLRNKLTIDEEIEKMTSEASKSSVNSTAPTNNNANKTVKNLENVLRDIFSEHGGGNLKLISFFPEDIYNQDTQSTQTKTKTKTKLPPQDLNKEPKQIEEKNESETNKEKVKRKNPKTKKSK